MSKFIHNNFESFQIEFEKTFNQKICHWINNNIDIKEGKNSRAIEVPKNFICCSLLREPKIESFDFNKLCNRLFSTVKNLNKRTPHEYLANQVHGTLQEVLHKHKLQKKYSNYDFSFASSEFNRLTKKREIYTKPNRKDISRDADLNFVCPEGQFNIHIKGNNTFKHRPQLTLRGGRLPEYDKIQESKKDFLHILVSPNEYISIYNFNKINDHIHSSAKLPSPQSKSWGGDGAHRIIFKQSIFNSIKTY